MKKILYSIIAGVTVFSASCSREVIETNDNQGTSSPYTAVSFDISSKTMDGVKSRITGAWDDGTKDFKLQWSKGDSVLVLSPTTPQGKVKAAIYEVGNLNDDKTKGNLKLRKDTLYWNQSGASQHFYGFYPSSAIVEKYSTLKSNPDIDKLTCDIYPTQTPSEYSSSDNVHKFKPDYNKILMYAKAEKAGTATDPISLSFQPLMSGVEVNIPIYDDQEIYSVTMESVGFRLTGQCEVDIKKVLSGGESESTRLAAKAVEGTLGNMITIPTLVGTAGSRTPVHAQNGWILQVTFFTLPFPTTLDGNQKVRFHILARDGMRSMEYTLVNRTPNPANELYVENGKIAYLKTPFLKQSTESYRNWMSRLDPNTYIGQLSIPGATYAAYNTEGSKTNQYNLKYQSYDLEDLFNKGVRAYHLDVALYGRVAGSWQDDITNTLTSIRQGLYYWPSFAYEEQGGIHNSERAKLYLAILRDGGVSWKPLYLFLRSLADKIKTENNRIGAKGHESAMVYLDVKYRNDPKDPNWRRVEQNAFAFLLDEMIDKTDLKNDLMVFRGQPLTLADTKNKILLVGRMMPNGGDKTDVDPDGGFAEWLNDTGDRNKVNTYTRNHYDHFLALTHLKNSGTRPLTNEDYDFITEQQDTRSGINQISVFVQNLLRVKNDTWQYDSGKTWLKTESKKEQLIKDIFYKSRDAYDNGTWIKSIFLNNIGGFYANNDAESSSESWTEGGNPAIYANKFNRLAASFFYQEGIKKSAPLGVVFMNYAGENGRVTIKDTDGRNMKDPDDGQDGVRVYGRPLTNLIIANNFAFPLKVKQ